MTRHTERALLLSLLTLTLIVGITALVQLHFNRKVYTQQEMTLQGALEDAVQQACLDPNRAELEKMRGCEEAIQGLQAEKDELKTLITASHQKADEVARELGEVAGWQETVQQTLGRVEGGMGDVSHDADSLLAKAQQQDEALGELREALSIPECIDEGSPCPPPQLGLLALAMKADLDQLRTWADRELDKGAESSFAGLLFRKLDSQAEDQNQRHTTLIRVLGEYETQLKGFQEVVAERDRLRDALNNGVAANPKVIPQGSGRFAVTIEPPADNYPCDNLELVAQLVDSAGKGSGRDLSPVSVSAEVCQGLSGSQYQCGRLGGDNNSVTLWAPYFEKTVGGRTLCQAAVELPGALLQALGPRADSLKLVIGVYLRGVGEPVSINLS